ncbi:hypothetical protein VTO73DRAFT_15545 [Trametes versicolor]
MTTSTNYPPLLFLTSAPPSNPGDTAILTTIRQDPHVAQGSPDPAIATLSEASSTELNLYAYSSARIRARIADAPFDWLDSFSHLVACLQGAPADTRDDLSDGERTALGHLQQPEYSDVDIDAVRLCQTSITLAVDSHLLEADMPQFDRSIYSYITRTTGTPPSEPPRAPKWMENVAYVNTAF